MNVVFADAFYFVARLNRRDQHQDCVSFVIMRERKVSAALTGDKHFEQAGFAALFK